MSASSHNKPIFLLMAVILLFGGLSAFFTLRQGSEETPEVSQQVVEEREIKQKLEAMAVDFTQVPAPATSSVKSSSPSKEPASIKPVVLPKKEDKPTLTPTVVSKEKKPEPPTPDKPTAAVKEVVPEKPAQAAPVTTKAVSAQPLVAPKPKVLMANKEKAWVRIDDHQTIIVRKGDSVGDMGRVLELDTKMVKFEKGTLPVTTE